MPRQRFLEFEIVDDAPLIEVDQEHLARLQAPLLDDLLIGNRQHAGFRGHDHVVVVGHQVTRRTQAVAIERGPDLAPVGEGHRRRAVPGLHHRRVVFVERAPLLVHQRVRFPGLGDEHHHGVRQRISAHDQQFQRVVERRGIGLVRVDQRPDLVEVGPEQRRRRALFTGAHPVVVAAQRVDLAVVRDHAERVRQRPGREGIGREALVHQRQRRNAARILQVEVILADLVGEQQSLVDNGSRRHRRLIELLAVFQPERADGVGRPAADDVELALERVGDHDVRTAADEHLADHRLQRTHRRRHGHLPVDRDVAPAQDDLAFGADGALDRLLAGQARRRLFRQKDHADAVVARAWQNHALPGHFFAQELIGNLDQDSGAVPHQRISAHGAAVIEILQDQQPLLDDRMALLALDVRHKTDPAGVVLVGRVIKPLPLRYRRVHHA